MAKREEIERRVEEILTPILDGFGFELWDVEYVKEGKEYYLRAYIDKEGGIMIDDCVDVSRKLSDILDAEHLSEEAYPLDVSSPGLGRKLVKDKEYERSIGRDVDVKFYRPVDGTKELTGKLTAFDKDTITVKIDDTGPKILPRSDIAMVKLSIDF